MVAVGADDNEFGQQGVKPTADGGHAIEFRINGETRGAGSPLTVSLSPAAMRNCSRTSQETHAPVQWRQVDDRGRDGVDASLYGQIRPFRSEPGGSHPLRSTLAPGDAGHSDGEPPCMSIIALSTFAGVQLRCRPETLDEETDR